MARDERRNKRQRTALIEAAARLIATEGTAALTLRRVADEVGTSTMAVYTNFGGMPELRRAVRLEGFARLAAHLARVPESDDPVADVVMLGRAYYENAMSNPHLYRVMFMEQPLDAADAAVGWAETFDLLVAAVQRSIDADRFDPSSAVDFATELWALEHGVVTLKLTNLLSSEQALACLVETSLRLYVSYGDDPEAANRSLSQAGLHAALGLDAPSS